MTLNKKIFQSSFVLWLLYVLSLCFIGTIIRLIFFIELSPINLTLSQNFSDIFNAFVRGFRFDLSAISYITLLLMPFIFYKKTKLFILNTGLKIHSFFILFWITISVFDIVFFSFYTDRLNLIAFGLLDDSTTALAKTFWKNYPVFKIITLIFSLSFIAYLLNHSLIKKNQNFILNGSYKIKLFLVFVLIILARGTLSLFPLGPDYAVISSIPFINHLSFGSAHALLRAAKLRSAQSRIGANIWDSNLNEFGYSESVIERENKAFEDYFGRKILSKSRYDLMKSVTPLQSNDHLKNVVLIVVESWGNFGFQQNKNFDLLGKMKNHFEQDFLNLNFLSNTPGTAGSLSCILAGIPQRAISPFLTESLYLNTSLSTSPALIYKKQGYETHFVYGGNPGWRDINKYAKIQGFDFVEGEIEIRQTLLAHQLNTAGQHDWGIYDEDLYKYIQIKLNEKSKIKKMYVVMTTTNHPPFELPLTYDQPKVAKDVLIENYDLKSRVIDPILAQKRFKTFRYSSDRLADFINEIKSGPLKKNTLLAVTADHSSWLINFDANERFTKDSVPFYIFVPEDVRKNLKLKQKKFRDQFGSHMDIWPTLYYLSLNQTEFESFGTNMFDTKILYSLNNSRLIVSKNEGVFVHDAHKSSYFINNQNLFDLTNTKNKTHEQLDLKYKSLMGSLDSYLNYSKKSQAN